MGGLGADPRTAVTHHLCSQAPASVGHYLTFLSLAQLPALGRLRWEVLGLRPQVWLIYRNGEPEQGKPVSFLAQ